MRAKLSELGAVITGNTPSKQEPKYWASSDIPFVKPDVINQDGITEVQTANDYISEMARSKARIAGKNVVLVTCIGTIGKICLTGKECAFNQQINAIIPNDKVLPEYLAYCIYYNRPKLIELANAPVVPIINKRQFEDFSVNIEESIERQGSIVTILKEVDRLIYYRQKQLQKLDDLVKARFVELFGAYPHNPMGWKTGTIRDVVTDVRYGSSRPAVDGGRYPYLRMNNITYGGELDLSDVKRIDVPENELEKCTVRRGDVLFNRTNSKELVGKTCVYDRDEMMVLAGFVIRVRVNDVVLPEFLSAFLNTDFSKRTLLGMCKAAIGQANINAQEMQNIGIYIPPIELQREFVQFKNQTDKSKAVIQKALDEAQLLFDSLMQKYFG